jgi:hypothetical protein
VFTENGAVVRPTQRAFDDAGTRRIERDPLRFRYQAVGGTSRAGEIRRHVRDDHPVVITFYAADGLSGVIPECES